MRITLRAVCLLTIALFWACADSGPIDEPATGQEGTETDAGRQDAAADDRGEVDGRAELDGRAEIDGRAEVDGGALARRTYYVSGRHLYDPCGERVVLRGVNEMVVWSAGRDGVPELTEIAKTGANAVRIVWNETGSAAELDRAVTNALDAQLLPMVEHHGATGDLSKVPAAVDYWVSEQVAAVLKKHEAHLLLNIANEAGDNTVTEDAFVSTYTAAIERLRTAGLEMPLVLDAPSWGQDIDMLQATGPALIEADPLHNLMLSVHMWWNDPVGDRVLAELAESVAMELPLIVGEFAQHAVYMCDQAPFAFEVLLEQAESASIGWLAWSWGGVANNDCKKEGPFDMTSNGKLETLSGWGEKVAVSDPYSIKNTSRRPTSLTTGSCP